MRTQNRRIFKVLIILSFLLLLVLNSKSITSAFRINLSDTVSAPLGAVHDIRSSIKSIIPFAAFREENRILRERLNLLNRRLNELKAVYDENERLKSFIGFKKTIPYYTVPAQVIGRDPTNWSNSVIINKGAADGVRQNRAVLSTKGLVGRVLEVGRRSSKVLLISDPNSKVGVVIQKNRQGGILIGRTDGKCKMIYISLDSDIAAGDKVITAGFGEIFPKDILVGEVARIDKEPGRLYKYAIVKPVEDLSRLEEVLCIR